MWNHLRVILIPYFCEITPSLMDPWQITLAPHISMFFILVLGGYTWECFQFIISCLSTRFIYMTSLTWRKHISCCMYRIYNSLTHFIRSVERRGIFNHIRLLSFCNSDWSLTQINNQHNKEKKYRHSDYTRSDNHASSNLSVSDINMRKQKKHGIKAAGTALWMTLLMTLT